MEGPLACPAVRVPCHGVLTVFLRRPLWFLREAVEVARQLDWRPWETLPITAPNADSTRVLDDVSSWLDEQTVALRKSPTWALKLVTIASRIMEAVLIITADERIESVDEGCERMDRHMLDGVSGHKAGRPLQDRDTVRKDGAILHVDRRLHVELVHDPKDDRKY